MPRDAINNRYPGIDYSGDPEGEPGPIQSKDPLTLIQTAKLEGKSKAEIQAMIDALSSDDKKRYDVIVEQAKQRKVARDARRRSMDDE